MKKKYRKLQAHRGIQQFATFSFAVTEVTLLCVTIFINDIA